MSISTNEKEVSRGDQGTLPLVKDGQKQRPSDQPQMADVKRDGNTSQQVLVSNAANSARFELTGSAEATFSADARPLLLIGMTKNAIMQDLFGDVEHHKFFAAWVQERYRQVPDWLIEAQARRLPKQRLNGASKFNNLSRKAKRDRPHV